jgi:hypothetical protein
MTVSADIWIEKNPGSLAAMGYEKGTVGTEPWGNTHGLESLRKIPLGTVFLHRDVTMRFENGGLLPVNERANYFRVVEDGVIAALDDRGGQARAL